MSQPDLHRAAFEAAEDALLLLENGRVIDANPSAIRLLAGSADGLIGRELTDLAPLLQPDGQALRRRPRAAARRGGPG